jgi:RimJ/RimL family protein N-acetyltransferase
MKTYETERLILKPTDKEDGEFIFKIMNTPKYYKYIGDRNIRTLEDAENYITQKMMPQYEKMGFGNFTVTLKSDGSKIGFCGIYVRPSLETPDIGFAFLKNTKEKVMLMKASLLKQLAKMNSV